MSMDATLTSLTVKGIVAKYGCHKGSASKLLARIQRELGCQRLLVGREKLFPTGSVEAAALMVQDHFARAPYARYTPSEKPTGRRHRTPQSASSRSGEYYILQLDPVARPARLKMGFTGNLDNRLADFRLLCPDLRILRRYPQTMGVEVWAHRFLTHAQADTERELLDVKDLDLLLREADAFFTRVAPRETTVPSSA